MKHMDLARPLGIAASAIFSLGLAVQAQAFLLKGTSANAKAGTAYYVATNGSDSNDGLAPTAGAGHGPFLTIGKCQSAMRGGTIKTCYIRAGTYTPSTSQPEGAGTPTTYLYLTSSDNGETWSYYPPDGADSAILNGQATFGCMTSSGVTYGMWIAGGQNITINGFTFENYTGSAVLIYGGSNSWYGNYFTSAVHTGINASGNLIENNAATNIYDVYPVPSGSSDTVATGAVLGAFSVVGSATNNTLTHNVAYHLTNMAFRGNCYSVNAGGDNLNGLVFSYNAAYATGLATQDEGQYYVYFGEGSGCVGGSVTVKYNYGRDQGTQGLSHCVYTDDNTQMSAFGNVCTGISSVMMFAGHGGSNNGFTGNIIASFEKRVGGNGRTSPSLPSNAWWNGCRGAGLCQALAAASGGRKARLYKDYASPARIATGGPMGCRSGRCSRA
jgi:hypothetical protein